MKTITITLQIGNTDDKLTQGEWARFVTEVSDSVNRRCQALHFFGAPPNYSEWQNVAWVFSVWPENAKRIKQAVSDCRAVYRQDSVAWTEGETFFV